jgi:hypothetical protein
VKAIAGVLSLMVSDVVPDVADPKLDVLDVYLALTECAPPTRALVVQVAFPTPVFVLVTVTAAQVEMPVKFTVPVGVNFSVVGVLDALMKAVNVRLVPSVSVADDGVWTKDTAVAVALTTCVAVVLLDVNVALPA